MKILFFSDLFLILRINDKRKILIKFEKGTVVNSVIIEKVSKILGKIRKLKENQ